MPQKKSISDHLDREAALELAVRDVLDRNVSERQAAKLRGVPRTTLQGRLGGRKERHKAHEREQHLSPAEEAELVGWCFDQERRFLPVRLPHIVGRAESIFRKRTGDKKAKLGDHWIERFLARHPELKVTTNKRIDERRVMAKNPVNIMEFYVLFSNIKEKFKVPPRRTFNMDEIGFQIGTIGSEKVVVMKRDDQNGYAGGAKYDGNRETVTSIDTMCAKGYELPSMIIMKGKRVQQAWLDNSPLDPRTKWAVSPNGWTDNELGVEYIKFFDELTSEDLLDGEYRLLILDGHGSHLTFEFLEYAEENHIIILGLPSHTTDILQPLDVGIFRPLKRYYGQAVDERKRRMLNITKATFSQALHEARTKAYTEENILSAFEATGISPFNPYRTQVMQGFLEKARGQQNTFQESRRNQDLVLKRLYELLNDPNADAGSLRRGLGEALEIVRGKEAQNTLTQEDLDQLREAIKQKARKQPRKSMGRARIYTQNASKETPVN